MTDITTKCEDAVRKVLLREYKGKRIRKNRWGAFDTIHPNGRHVVVDVEVNIYDYDYDNGAGGATITTINAYLIVETIAKRHRSIVRIHID